MIINKIGVVRQLKNENQKHSYTYKKVIEIFQNRCDIDKTNKIDSKNFKV